MKFKYRGVTWRMMSYDEAPNEYHCIGFGFVVGFVMGLYI